MEASEYSKLQKNAFVVGSVLGPSDEKSYWLSKTPAQRLEALEWMRQTIYGYDPSATRLQRVLEIIQCKHGTPQTE